MTVSARTRARNVAEGGANAPAGGGYRGPGAGIKEWAVETGRLTSCGNIRITLNKEQGTASTSEAYYLEVAVSASRRAMTQKMSPAPAGWGNDRLTEYLDNFRGNQFATFDGMKRSTERLIEIDLMFFTFLNGAINLRPWFPANFMLRSHSALRSAIGSAMAGQAYEASAVLRLSLEFAAYGLFIGSDKKRAEAWLRRHDSEKDMLEMRNMFLIKNINNHTHQVSPSLAVDFKDIYDNLIDFGAHPNERGVTESMDIIDSADRKEFRAIYLHSDPRKIDAAFARCYHVGLWSLLAFRLVWPDRFKLMGLSEKLETLTK
jgi:hypothetical protein